MEETKQPNLPMDLGPEEAEEALGTTEGTYTTERLKAKAPKVYEAVARLLAAGAAIRTICKLMGVSAHTVIAIRHAEPERIATLREHIRNECAKVSALTLELVTERLQKMQPDELTEAKDIKDLLLGMGVAIDKGLLLGGEATSRMEIVTSTPEHDDYNRSLQEMGCAGKNLNQRAPAALGPSAGADEGGASWRNRTADKVITNHQEGVENGENPAGAG